MTDVQDRCKLVPSRFDAAVAIRHGEQGDARALKTMFRQVIANNRAGGWRKLKQK